MRAKMEDPNGIFPPLLKAQLETLAQPALHLVRTEEPAFSKLGGMPLAPAWFAWPECQGSPLSFLAQLDLSEIYPGWTDWLLPTKGFLYFFFDQEQGALVCGEDMQDSWRVIFCEEEVSDFVPTNRPAGLADEAVFSEKPLKAVPMWSWPSLEEKAVEDLKLTWDKRDAYSQISCDVYGGQPAHQVLGTSGDIGPEDEFGEKLQLLMSISTDRETGMMWGDVGSLHFWIDANNLAQRNFNEVFLVMEYS